MRLMAARFAQIFFIELLNRRVVMRFSQRHARIQFIDGLGSNLTDINKVSQGRRLDRLSTTIDTTAWACHYFDKVVVRFPFLDISQQFLRVCQTRANRNLDFNIANFIRSFLDSLGAANVIEF